jgi:ribose 5-phosphate isomerase B
MRKETIVLGSDHAGFGLKEYIKSLLTKWEYAFVDMGPRTPERCDYPDFAEKAAMAVRKKKNGKGILMCGTGIGISIAANKIPGIRAALVESVQKAKLSRQHNDANILVLGGRPYNKSKVRAIVKAWLSTPFAGGRHRGRVRKIIQLEKKYCNR